SVPCPVFIRETFFGSRWEYVQRPTARHYADKDSKLAISSESLPSETMEPQRKEDKEFEDLDNEL
ncbi:hypothetical protein STEG23_035587, partial [Scotinomys teguina]